MASDRRLNTVNNILVPIGPQERSSKQHEQTHISLLSGTKFKREKQEVIHFSSTMHN